MAAAQRKEERREFRGDGEFRQAAGRREFSGKPVKREGLREVSRDRKPEMRPVRRETQREVRPVRNGQQREVRPVRKEIQQGVRPVRNRQQPEIYDARREQHFGIQTVKRERSSKGQSTGNRNVKNIRPVQDSRKRQNRKKKKQLFKRRLGILVSAMLLFMAFQVIKQNPSTREHAIGKGPSQTQAFEDKNISEISVGSLSKELETALKEQAEEDERIVDVLEHYDSYPEDLLELLSKNPEAVDFVLDYPEKGDKSPADSLEGVKKGTIPSLLQWDESWGYTQYGGGFLACTGCGPTCLSMVAAGLTGDSSVTPYKVAQFAEKNGYYEAGAGTKWSMMTEGAAEFGIRGREISLDETAVLGELDAGHPIICSVRPGDFTTTGHFIVLAGRKDGKIQVHDPNSRIRSEKLWDYDTLARQIRNLWAFE